MTIAERHAIAEARRAQLRRWRPTLADLFGIGRTVSRGDTRQPSATKRGPGRTPRHGKPSNGLRSRLVTHDDYEAHGLPPPAKLPHEIDAEKRAARRERKAARLRGAA
jgi:hypothetical protein